MDSLAYKTYTYFGTGADRENFQMEYTYFIDDVLYNNIVALGDGTHDLQKWEDLNISPAQAIEKVNTFLNGRYLSNTVEYKTLDPYSDPAPNTVFQQAIGQLQDCGISVKVYHPNTGSRTQFPKEIAFLNGVSIPDATAPAANIGVLWFDSHMSYSRDPQGESWTIRSTKTNSGNMVEFQYNDHISNLPFFRLDTEIYPSGFFTSSGVDPTFSGHRAALMILLKCNVDNSTHKITSVAEITIQAAYSESSDFSAYKLRELDLTGSQPEEEDLSNPYAVGGNSKTGGGNGTLPSGSLDSIDPATIPNLPGISAANLGFITMYNPTVVQLHSLSDFMWSGAFDLATYKKLFSDPMQSIIGLAIVPVAPSIGGSKNVHFGSIDSGVSMPYLSTNYVRLDCGSVALERYVGCFMDNDPYTKISIYLPFIGIRQLSADDVIGGSIHVVYNIDVLSGACACFIEHSTRGVLYSYNGSCITNVPLTAVNFSGAIQNAVSAIGSAVGMVAGMATGAAPVAAMGAVGLLTSAANTALNSKPQVQRSGNLGGSAGIMSIMKPYVIIERPSLSVPNNVQHYVGQTSNITMTLGDCRGFTLCEYVHIDNVSATTEEIAEIESLLKQGVIL